MLRPCRSAKRNGRVHTEWTSALYGERIAVTYEKGYTSVNFLRPLTWKRLLCRASLPNPPGPPYQGGKDLLLSPAQGERGVLLSP